METQRIFSEEMTGAGIRKSSPISPRDGIDEFQAMLAASSESFPISSTERTVPPAETPSDYLVQDGPRPISRQEAAARYEANEAKPSGPTELSGLQKYKDDQLLQYPGGDHYYLDRSQVIQEPEEQQSFWGRVGKDVTDAFQNMKNFFNDLLFGAEIHYRDESGAIQSANRRGLLGSVVDFFSDFGSALSFGAWRPDGEEEPDGFMQKAGFFVSKLKEAFFGDLVQGVCGSAIHMGKDLLFAGWNAVEVIPDATVGNLDQGRKMTTEVFDNGQVALDYLTDIVPFGDAWVRVHSVELMDFKPPLLRNLQTEERSSGDPRWQYIRNTPFRKTIETLGSLVMDVLTFKMLGRTNFFSDDRK